MLIMTWMVDWERILLMQPPHPLGCNVWGCCRGFGTFFQGLVFTRVVFNMKARVTGILLSIIWKRGLTECMGKRIAKKWANDQRAWHINPPAWSIVKSHFPSSHNMDDPRTHLHLFGRMMLCHSYENCDSTLKP